MYPFHQQAQARGTLDLRQREGMYCLVREMWWIDERTSCPTVAPQVTAFLQFAGRVTARGSQLCGWLSGRGGRSLCAEATPGSRRWGAASRPRTPDNSARGGEPRGPETLTRSPAAGARPGGSAELGAPIPPADRALGGLPRGDLPRRRGGSARPPTARRLRAGPAAREAPAPAGAAPAMGEAASAAPALWDWGYLDRCFARHRVCISFSLWLCASSCWIAAHTL